MVAGRPSPAPLGPVYPAGLALGGGWGLLWPYRSTVVGWCLYARRWFMAARCLNGAFTTCCKKHGFEEIAELAPCQQLNGHIAAEFVTCRSSTAAFYSPTKHLPVTRGNKARKLARLEALPRRF